MAEPDSSLFRSRQCENTMKGPESLNKKQTVPFQTSGRGGCLSSCVLHHCCEVAFEAMHWSVMPLATTLLPPPFFLLRKPKIYSFISDGADIILISMSACPAAVGMPTSCELCQWWCGGIWGSERRTDGQVCWGLSAIPP